MAPVPGQYASRTRMKDGTPVILRPIRPEDVPLMVGFHESLSQHSVYTRYFQVMGLDRRTAYERLMRICFVDYAREVTLVAERKNDEAGEPEILGVGRLSKNRLVPGKAEVALLVSDRFQHQGLGTTLLEKLLEAARVKGLSRVTADMLFKNRPTQRLLEKFDFRLKRDKEEGVVRAELDLREDAERRPR